MKKRSMREVIKRSTLGLGAVVVMGLMAASVCPSVSLAAGPTNVTDAVLWLDASQLIGLNNGDTVSSWTDMSGNNNHPSASGSAATYQTNVLNGQPVVRFNPDGNASFNFTRISTIRTVFWVLKNTNPGQHFMLGDSATYDFHSGATALWSTDYVHDNIKNGTTKVMGEGVNGTTTALPSSSFSLVSLVTAGNVQANQLSLDRAIPSRSWAGDMAEVIIYNRALTAAEELAVGTYLTAKYGLLTYYSEPVMMYWDNNGSTTGFGTAAGTWAASTTGNDTQGWSTNSLGETPPVDTTTTLSDTLFFGFSPNGLGAGTITVDGTVAASSMTFGADSGAITLSGGTITLAGTTAIGVDNASDTISSVLTGAAGSLTKAGSGRLILAATNTYSGATTINGGTVRLGYVNEVMIPNSGFETGVASGWAGAPAGASWTWGGNAGIDHNSGEWYSTLAGHEGVCAGFIQMDASISQSITVGSAGLYTISFQAEGRRSVYGPEGVIVKVDGVTVGTWTAADVSQSQWRSYSTTVDLTSGAHMLAFHGNNTLGGDRSVCIDNVRMYQAESGSGLLPATTAVTLGVSGATLDVSGITQTIGSLAGVAGSSILSLGNLTVGGSGASTTFAGAISGNGSLTKVGAGTLYLSGANTFTGATTIAVGRVEYQNANAVGSTSKITVNNGANLFFTQNANNATISTPLELIGNGNYFWPGNSGALLTYIEGGGLITFSGPVTLLGDTWIRIFAATSSMRLTGPIGGTGKLTLVGSGGAPSHRQYFTLSGASTFNGDMYIENFGCNPKVTLSGGDNRLPATSVLHIGAYGGVSSVLDINACNQTLAGLSDSGVSSVDGARRVINTSAAGATTYTDSFTGTDTTTLVGRNVEVQTNGVPGAAYANHNNYWTITIQGNKAQIGPDTGLSLALPNLAGLDYTGISGRLNTGSLSGDATRGIGLGFFASASIMASAQFRGLVLCLDGALRLVDGAFTTSIATIATGLSTGTDHDISFRINPTSGDISDIYLDGVLQADVTTTIFNTNVNRAGAVASGAAGGTYGYMDNFVVAVASVPLTTLTLNTSANQSFSGNIGGVDYDGNVGNNLALVKTGSGTQTLTSACSYIGSTAVSNGVLKVTGTQVLPTTTDIYISTTSGAKLELAFEGTSTVRSLTIDGELQERNKVYSAANRPQVLSGTGFLAVTEGSAPRGTLLRIF